MTTTPVVPRVPRKSKTDASVLFDLPGPRARARYRIMAVAVEGERRFGLGESTVTARLPRGDAAAASPLPDAA